MSKSLADTLEDAFVQCRDMDASLNERLQALAEIVGKVSPAFAAAVERLVNRLQQSGAGATAPQPGDAMPPFHLPDQQGRLVSLDDFLSKGPVAIAFHRGHWCPYCRITSSAMAKAQNDIAAEGGQIVAIMPDRQQFVAEFRSDTGAQFPILTDLDNAYALSLNLAFWVDDEMAGLIRAAGRDVPTFQGNESWTLPIPATFVVGRDGRITTRFVDPDYRKRLAVADLTAALRSAR